MATVREFVDIKLKRLSIELASVELDVLLLTNGVDDNTQCDTTSLPVAKRILMAALSELLAMPDVTEGGYAIKWDRAAVGVYLNQLRDELGIIPASTSAIVQDKSYLW